MTNFRELDHQDRLALRPPFAVGEQVVLLIYKETNMGLKAVVNTKYEGLVFKDDILHNLRVGQRVKGFVKKVRDDNRIDLSLQPLASGSLAELAQLILHRLEEAGGALDINAKSSAEVINEAFGVSRKKFKIALGNLYRKRLIVTDESGTQLVK